jgi:uncharacterized iron-regulated protein
MKSALQPLTGLALGLSLMCLAGFRATPSIAEMRFYDLEQKSAIDPQLALDRLKQAKIVLIGEHHTDAAHHLAQLRVIQAMHTAGLSVAVGLEMFRKESQAQLQEWIAGRISESDFQTIYTDNWNYPWPLYRGIFELARNEKIPLLGLNVPRRITSQVAYHGFESLSDEQKGELSGISCNVGPDYKEFIRNAYGSHGHGQLGFDYFCEAQLVWDTIMAVNALDYLAQHPQMTLVILAGSGHAHKMGIPAQIRKRSDLPVIVILPETAGSIEPDRVTSQQADWILLSAE